MAKKKKVKAKAKSAAKKPAKKATKAKAKPAKKSAKPVKKAAKKAAPKKAVKKVVKKAAKSVKKAAPKAKPAPKAKAAKPTKMNKKASGGLAHNLVKEFEGDTAFAIIKHTNACGVSIAATVKEAYLRAFQADTISAFGGVLVTNATIDLSASEEINKLFFEILIAPSYTADAVALLKSKKNRIILKQNQGLTSTKQFKSLLNGVIEQDLDLKTDGVEDLKVVTKIAPASSDIKALLFASKICKHTKSNTIILAKEGQLLASGVGQTSRVDALQQAIEKAAAFGFDLKGAVMASDAFFPFPDCVEIAWKQGIKSVIQPGGSIKDQDSIAFCDAHDMAMVFTGIRHFKH